MLTIKIYLKFSASASAVFHFPRFFFFSTQFKQCQSQQISARYGRFNYNTPEYVEKGHFLTNKCCNQPRVSCHVECCNRPFNMLNVSLNENKNGWDRFDPLNESTDLLNDNIFF